MLVVHTLLLTFALATLQYSDQFVPVSGGGDVWCGLVVVNVVTGTSEKQKMYRKRNTVFSNSVDIDRNDMITEVTDVCCMFDLL